MPLSFKAHERMLLKAASGLLCGRGYISWQEIGFPGQIWESPNQISVTTTRKYITNQRPALTKVQPSGYTALHQPSKALKKSFRSIQGPSDAMTGVYIPMQAIVFTIRLGVPGRTGVPSARKLMVPEEAELTICCLTCEGRAAGFSPR